MLVDVLRAVVRVKVEYDKRELLQQLFQYRDQVTLGDLLDRANHFKLGLFVNGINMVEPFGPILVTLMDGIHPDIAWLTIGLRLTPLTNGVDDRAGFVKTPPRPLVGAGSPQVVQVRYRDTGQALVGREIKQPPGTLTELFGVVSN